MTWGRGGIEHVSMAFGWILFRNGMSVRVYLFSFASFVVYCTHFTSYERHHLKRISLSLTS